MVFRRFLVALWFVVAASWLKNVSREIWKQCPGAKVCFLVMLRSSMSYNKVVKCFFLLADKYKLAIEATEPGGALRDDTKNGCEGDYTEPGNK